jgi:hypothetical protein
VFERLRVWRDERATAEDLHYTVPMRRCAIATATPQSDDELLAMPGIATTKLAQAARAALAGRRTRNTWPPCPPLRAVGGEAARTFHEERVAEARKLHARAFERWSDDEDARLRGLIEDQRTLDEISRALERQPNAIRIRTERLGLTPQLVEDARSA